MVVFLLDISGLHNKGIRSRLNTVYALFRRYIMQENDYENLETRIILQGVLACLAYDGADVVQSKEDNDIALAS